MFTITNEPTIVADARQRILDTFSDLEFYPEDHVYKLHGRRLLSASGIGHRFESRPFDADAQAVAYAKKHGETPEYWKEQWRQCGEEAANAGTKVHEYGESLAYVLAGHPEMIVESAQPQYDAATGVLAPLSPKEQSVEKFLRELPSCYYLVMNEAQVYSGLNPDPARNLKEQICGTFDMLYYYDGEGDPSRAGFIIFDYKTNSTLTSDFSRSMGVKMLSPFADLYQEAMAIYTIQLSLYALMVDDIGLPVIDRRIVWLREDGYEIIPVADVSEQLRQAL